MDLSLHEILPAGWGFPLAELFDLKRLADHGVLNKRWDFLPGKRAVGNPQRSSKFPECACNILNSNDVKKFVAIHLERGARVSRLMFRIGSVQR